MKQYRNLKATALKAGLFKANLGYYVWKCTSNLIILSGVIAMLTLSSSLLVHLAAGCLLALFYQQCGWLAHDFLHHQVFEQRWKGDLMGMIINNVCQGFSVYWWKNKHNTHHAVPNMQDGVACSTRADPDIDTMPLLAWSLRMARRAQDSTTPGVHAWFVKHQSVLYFPILFLARLSWVYQSFGHVFFTTPATVEETAAAGKGRTTFQWLNGNDHGPKKYRHLEQVTLIIHYLWHAVLFLSTMSPLRALLVMLVAQGVCGLLLALVFGVGHNGMTVYDADAPRVDFLTQQITTTRNVESSWFTDWFCGGLQYQIEHHLFPSMPRHNLGKMAPLTKDIAQQLGVKYHVTGLFAGTQEVLAHLNKVSEEFIKEFPAL